MIKSNTPTNFAGLLYDKKIKVRTVTPLEQAEHKPNAINDAIRTRHFCKYNADLAATIDVMRLETLK